MPSKGSGLRGVRQQEPSILTQFVTSVWNARAHLAPQIADTSNQTACMQAGKGLVGDPLLIFGPRVTVRSCSKEECTAVLPAVWCTAALQGVPQARCGCVAYTLKHLPAGTTSRDARALRPRSGLRRRADSASVTKIYITILDRGAIEPWNACCLTARGIHATVLCPIHGEGSRGGGFWVTLLVHGPGSSPEKGSRSVNK